VEIAEARPRLLDFTAEMLGGLARKDQRAAGELYVRGLLADGQRKSMVPMAARLGIDHQRLQQFITSSTWDYAAVRRNVARWFASSQPVAALVVDDTGFPKDGYASPCVARQYSGTLGKTGNCQVAVSVHLVSEHASCAADWRLFCPESWDDQALDDPVAAAGARRRRERAGIPDEVRHREKWRLALDMIQEMAGPGGWGILEEITAADGGRPVVAADIAYEFRPVPPAAHRRRLAVRGRRQGQRQRARRRCRPAGQALRRPRPAPEGRLSAPAGAPAHPRARARRPGPAGDLAARHQDQQGQPRCRHDQLVPGHPGPPGRQAHTPPGRPQRAGLLAAGRMAARGRRAHRLLAVHSARGHHHRGTGAPGQDPLASTTTAS
jgi:DDE superfamily endonuclease